MSLFERLFPELQANTGAFLMASGWVMDPLVPHRWVCPEQAEIPPLYLLDALAAEVALSKYWLSAQAKEASAWDDFIASCRAEIVLARATEYRRMTKHSQELPTAKQIMVEVEERQ